MSESISVRMSAGSDLKRVLMDAGQTVVSEQELAAMLHADVNGQGRAKLKVLKDGKTAFTPVGERVARTLALYAVLEMGEDHEWAVVNVVEEEDMRALVATGSLSDRTTETMKTLAATGSIPDKMVRDLNNMVPMPQMVRKEYDDGPVLVRWESRPEETDPGQGKTEAIWSEELLTYKGFKAKVSQLIMAGIDPEKIEIWTGLRRPKVSIVLE